MFKIRLNNLMTSSIRIKFSKKASKCSIGTHQSNSMVSIIIGNPTLNL